MPNFSTPRTWADGELVTASQMNTDVRDNITNIDDWRGEIGYVEYTADSGTFTTAETTLATLTVSVPTGGRNLKVTAYASIYTSVGGDEARLRLYHGSTQVADRIYELFRANISHGQVLIARIPAPASGNQTFTLKGQRQSGSGTFTGRGAASNPRFILVEGL